MSKEKDDEMVRRMRAIRYALMASRIQREGATEEDEKLIASEVSNQLDKIIRNFQKSG